jgi:hypothetical protein
MPGVCVSYRLDFASGAWSELGLLERAVFRDVTEKLRNVAAEAPRLAGTTEGFSSPNSRARLDCGEYAALYEIDHLTCTVLVVELVHAGPSAASG